MNSFEEAKKAFAAYGVDVEAALKKAAETPISLQCWQLDDVLGFEDKAALSGGIQTTGNYPGKARNWAELSADLDVVLSLIPGKKKINVHASYQTDAVTDRASAGPEQYKSWVDYATKRGLGLDFNPTVFSSPYMNDGMSLSSPDKATRDYWIKHCVNSIKVTEAFAKATGQRALCNIWIPDGLKDNPNDRYAPRKRLMESLDEILKTPYDRDVMDVSVESKVFGIGVESYTVGSHEFYMAYASSRNVICLLDTGHYHPTEVVADKIPSMLLFFPRLALHVSRPVRWDSDHVLRLNDELQDVFNELVRCDALEKTYIGLDYFDASINRVAALVIGARNAEKALMKALLTPWDALKKAQEEQDHTLCLELSEEVKMLPYEAVFEEYCRREGVKGEAAWYADAKAYEAKILKERE